MLDVEIKVRTDSYEQQNIADPKIALNFINEYVGLLNNSFAGKECEMSLEQWLDNRTDVSSDFKNEYHRILKEAALENPGYGLGFDPILDAQDFPDSGFELYGTVSSDGYLTVKGIEWAGFKIRMRLVKEKSTWLVDGSGIINIPESEQAIRQ
ncbi:MAG: hypothetical protein KJP14_07080 [Eudoraea sp.]|nr:hypothetical protein [Eudoraea sp.]MBT8223090.1 hypothetical protein [Eudoraea sp.]MBT8322492.1 hypothetical protein [Eudoraea sp.]